MLDARVLHVTNGNATTALIEAAGIPGARSVWADPLYEGPVPAGLCEDALLDVRARHLGGGDGSAAIVNDLRQWRITLERHDHYDELILWFEHDLFDQLNLIQILTWIREHVPAGKAVTLISVGSFPGHPRFKGLGELSPGELASLLDTRQPVTDAQYSLAERAWGAFRHATPEALDALRRSDTSPLPYLSAALTRFLQEFPWTGDGLSRSERRLLELASGGGIRLTSAFSRMHDGEDAYYVTDMSLAALARSLAGTSPALLTLTSAMPLRGDALSGQVTATTAGAAVLAGQQDRVTTCGIDRWLGGVHLHSGGPIWRWDPSAERIIVS